MTMNNPFYAPLNEAIRDKIEANADILITLDPALDQQKQIEQIGYMIAEGVKMLFLTPVDWKNIKPALEACQKAGVIVINVDAPVFEVNMVETIIASDNYSAGKLCAEDLIKRISSGTIAVITHPGAKSGVDRIAGFDDLIFAGGANYIEAGRHDSKGQLEIAMPLLENLLKENRDIDAVMALNDPSAQGAIAALGVCGFEPGEVLVYGIDGSPDVKRLIQDGWVTGTAAQSPMRMGRIAAETAYKILNGESVEKSISVPVEFISAENIADFDLDGWQ
ncbi:MAG: sugar ABC transporter substrate-binding protein [Clostridiales bacterium]|nr:sugar ABC transporter substrate-binding protein [Clostridiales bacterium]